MSVKDYLQPYIPANPRLMKMGRVFALERIKTFSLDIQPDDPRIDDELQNSFACGLRGMFFTLARGVTETGNSFNVTPSQPGMQEIMAKALFMRLPIRPQEQAEAYPLLMEEFRRLAKRDDLGLPDGSRLEAAADCVMLHPGVKPPAPPPSTRIKAKVVKYGKGEN